MRRRARGAGRAAARARRRRGWRRRWRWSSSTPRAGRLAAVLAGDRALRLRLHRRPSSALPAAPRRRSAAPSPGRCGVGARRRRRRRARLRARLPRPAAVRERRGVRRTVLPRRGPAQHPDAAVDLQRRLGDAARHRHRHPAGADRDDGRGAARHLHLPDGARPGDPDADVRLHRRDLRRQPHRDPAQHPRHAGERRDDARRLPAGQAGQGRARDGARHHLLGARHAGRRVLPRAARAAARRGGAEVRLLRVLLARALRRDDLGADDRVRQPAQGLHRRHPRASRRDDRHGGPARLPALHLRPARARRRRRPDPGDGRRLRPRRDPRRDEAARRGAHRLGRRPGGADACARSSSTGAPSSAPG